MARLITYETEMARRLAMLAGVPHTASYGWGDEVKTFEIPRGPSGEMARLLLDRPVGEFLGSSDMLEELAQKITVDVELGRDAIPTLYNSLYRTTVNPNFPRLLDANMILYANVVFLEHVEGQEVRFGTTASETGVTVPILTYTAGFEWDEDVEVYDEGWRLSMLNEAIGRAYNALLDHLHLSPILTFAYAGIGNQSPALSPAGEVIEDTRATLRGALIDAAQNTDTLGRLKPIRPTTILCSTADAITINDALSVGNRPSIGTVAGGGDIDVLLGRITDTATAGASVNALTTIIAYDGNTVEMGNLDFTYAGVTPGKCYLIQPQRNLFEFVKHDLRVDTDRPADLSRLIAAQMVARTRRGLLMSPDLSVWEVTLP